MFFRSGRVRQKIIFKGDCLKWEAWTVCRFNRGLDENDGDGVFERGLIPQCTACY